MTNEEIINCYLCSNCMHRRLKDNTYCINCEGIKAAQDIVKKKDELFLDELVKNTEILAVLKGYMYGIALDAYPADEAVKKVNDLYKKLGL